MARQFPLIRNFHNLIWNLKHYQPSSKAPPFKSSRHPFCTNIQLRDASYAYWFEETSRELRQKLVFRRDDSGCRKEKLAKESVGLGTSLPTVSAAHTKLQEPHFTSASTSTIKAEISPEEIEIVRMFQQGQFAEMYAKLKQFKAENHVIPIELLNEMASRVQNNLPTDTVEPYLLQSDIEPPLFYLKSDLRYSKFLGRMHPSLVFLHKSFTLYEDIGLQNEKFLQHYIWLSYHKGDLNALQKLLYNYLKNSTYDSRTLSYIVNAFVYSYDVQFAKSLLENIIAMNKPLAESLIASTLVAYVKVGALYDNLFDTAQLWLTSDNCESPYPKTIALLSEQTYKFGTDAERSQIDQACEALGYDNNFLVQIARTQMKILNRDNNQKKLLTEEDIHEILGIRNNIGTSRYALKVYYESYIKFLTKYCNMAVVQLILKEMKQDNIPLSKFAYNSIIQHYVSNSKFVLLSKFMERFVSKYIAFEPTYVQQFFEGFINTYPYHGEKFSQTFHEWLRNNTDLSESQKHVIANACQITTSGSKLTPSFMKRPLVEKNKKYDSDGWSNLQQSRGPIAKTQKRHQVQFRMIEGIRGVMRKGIRPDFHIIENTLKNSNNALRKGILESLGDMRMAHCATRLRIHHFLLTYPRKNDFRKFVEENFDAFNTSDRLLIARRSMNACAYETASSLLSSVRKVDMSDGRQMMRLNLVLRNSIYQKDYDKFVKAIDEFPIDETTLSPYIYHQCRFVEKSLKRRITRITSANPPNTETETETETETDGLDLALAKLRGLIGDIEVRLAKDEADISALLKHAFGVMNEWIKSSTRKDERKV